MPIVDVLPLNLVKKSIYNLLLKLLKTLNIHKEQLKNLDRRQVGIAELTIVDRAVSIRVHNRDNLLNLVFRQRNANGLKHLNELKN